MKHNLKRLICTGLTLVMLGSAVQPALAAGITYMPGVTAEMSDASYWADLHADSDKIIMTPEEIDAFNEDTALASGTMVMDLRTAAETFDGKARNEMIRSSSTADAEYYFGWTYGGDGKKAEWSYYEKMIRNCIDPKAKSEMPVRYAVAVERTVLQVFPTTDPIWDDPKDVDFDYQHLSSVRVNDPMLIYTTSRDGKYYLARSRDCSGWIPAEDVAICADKAEWLDAWDISDDEVLVVIGSKEYTDASNYAPDTARRMLTQGTALRLVTDLEPDQLINNRSPYHNYVVWMPVRRADGTYEKQMALIAENADVHVGYLPLTQENIAMVMLNNLGDAYGWGGMLDVEDCSGLIRTVYACFGLYIGRNGNWQWNMNMEKINLTNMSIEEKCLVLDGLPLGAALCFPGHEMMYLGKVDGKYYVVSTVSSIMSPDTGNRLRTRDVMINALDVKRANGQSWLQAINQASMPCYGKIAGKTYNFPQEQWYHEGVSYALANSLVKTNADGTFGIGADVSRGVLAQALWTIAGKPAVESTVVFDDIAEDHVNRTAILWAVDSGILCGKTEKTFAPDGAVSREMLVMALWKYEAQQEIPVDAAVGTLVGYKDAKRIAAEAQDAFRWACGAGILSGDAEQKLCPADTATREQLAMLLYRYAQLPRVQTEAETPVETA